MSDEIDSQTDSIGPLYDDGVQNDSDFDLEEATTQPVNMETQAAEDVHQVPTSAADRFAGYLRMSSDAKVDKTEEPPPSPGEEEILSGTVNIPDESAMMDEATANAKITEIATKRKSKLWYLQTADRLFANLTENFEATGVVPDADMRALSVFYGRLLVSDSLQLSDAGVTLCLSNSQNELAVYQVADFDTYYIYKTLNYCPCEAFRTSSKELVGVCKHILAIRFAEALKKTGKFEATSTHITDLMKLARSS